MKIAFNPSTVAALTAPPNNKDITFDLRGRNIFARGVKFYGTDTNTWRQIKINNVSIGTNILDLRNGSNTTLTNTNGVVTINSTWRPVVDNLTSDSTTSSLSAKQGKTLKALIDGKSNTGHTHDDRYLRLSGGTMNSDALITFADSGSWGTDKGPQGARGGLRWTGQSDSIKLYAEETAVDNLDLVIQFGDDNSNGLSIRNKVNTQTSYISASGVITTGTFKGNLDWSYITNKPATATRWPSWEEVTDKPGTFTPAVHTHGLSNSVFFLNMPNISGNAKWKEALGYPVNSNLLLSVRINSPAPDWCVGNYGSGILYGGSDTKGFMSSAYNEPFIMWAGGNGSSEDSIPKWYIGIKGTHKSIYNLTTIALEANTAYNLRHSHSNKSVLDGITSALVNSWNTAYNFVNNITKADTDKVINKWDEIVNFLAGIDSNNKLNTLLNSKLSVYELADKTNVGIIKNNGIYYSTTDASSGTLTNSPFNTGFALINMTSYDWGDDLRRSRLAFNAYGEIKVSDDRGQANTAETWYNVLTSKNSGISGSTIKLNGTSITVYSSDTADGRYVKKSGDTMSGALNFANGTWNKVGDDSYMGDCNVSGHFGIKAANTTYPGIAFFNNANAHLGSLTAYSGNIKYGAYSLQFLDNGNTSVGASTWTNPFSAYDKDAVKDGQAICVWGQSSRLSNLASDSGDMSLWLKRVNAKAATLNMVLDGEYYANGTQRLAHISEIPSSLKNPYALTISLNGTSQGPYDGSAAKSINITPGSIGAATSDHNHDGRYVYNYGGTQMDGASVGKNALGMTTNSGVTGAWWHILQAAWNGEYRWNSQIAFPTQNRNGMYYRSGLDDNTKWGSWVKLLDTNNYSGVLDSRYYTESEVDSLLDAKLNRQNLSYGTWNPRGYNLAADYFYNGGDLSISESGGQIHVSVDGYFWQNEGRYRVLDTSDVAELKGDLTVHQYLSATDTAWWPLVWGGSSHNNTSDSTGAVYKSHDKLSWQTSSQTLYATNIRTENIKHLSIGGGIYWNPNVESATDGSDAASITLVKSGVAGGTTLVLSQMNDANDTIQFKTNTAAKLYHNSYPILTTQNTYVNNHKGYIYGAEITQVNNSDTVDGWHKDEINRTLFITSSTSGLSSYWAKLWEINLNNQYNDVTITFLAAASYYPSYFSIFSVYLRQNGSGTSKSISARLVELIGNIAVGDTELRLYVNNTTGNCQLWGNVKNQYGTMNLSVLKKAWRTNTDSSNIGTFFSTSFGSVQSLPGDGWYKVGVIQQGVVGAFNPSSHTHTWTSITDKIVAGNEFNIVNAGFKENLWFNYLPINDRSKSATISAYCFGNGNKGYTAVKASGFIKNGGNEDQLLRADGGVAGFNWAGQSGQPTWLWGGNNFNSYYVYNPSNFRVAYAASAGNADTVDGEHASSFVRAGFIDNNGANLNSLDTYSFIKSVNSTIASASPGGYTGWYNVIQAVHRNGAGDGPGYIGQIALGMTTNLSAMFYRTKYNGSWYAWNEVLTTNTGLLRYSRNNVNISSPNCSPIPPSLLEWTVGYPRLYDPEFNEGDNNVWVYNNAGNGVVTVTRVHDTNVGNSSSYVMKVVSASGASPNYGGWHVQTQTELGKVYTCLFRASIPSGVEIEFNTNSIGSGGGAAWLTNNMGTGKWTWYAMQVYCGSGGSTTFFFSAKSPCTWYLSYVNVIENNRASYAGLRSVYSDYLKQNASLVFGRSELQYFNQYTGVTSGAKNNANPTTDWYHILRMNHANNSGYFVDLAIPFNNNRIQFRRIVSGSDNGWRRVITEEPNHDVILREANTSGNVGIGINNPAYKLDVNGQMRAEGFHHWTVNSDNYMLLAGGGYKSFGGDDSNPIFLGYLNLDHGNDGTISSSFSCLGYSVPFTYTRGGNYCRIYIPDTTHQVFYIKAATASVNYSGGGMDTWTGVHRGSGAWWLHCYTYDSNEIRVKGFCQNNNNNDSWWGGNPLWSGNDGANKITVCIFGYVKFR